MKKIILSSLAIFSLGVNSVNASLFADNFGSQNIIRDLQNNQTIWQRLHCSSVEQGFIWQGDVAKFLNCGGLGFLNKNFVSNLQNNFINSGVSDLFGTNFINNSFVSSQLEKENLKLDEEYFNFRVEIAKLFEKVNSEKHSVIFKKEDFVETKNDAIFVLKSFDKIISNTKKLPKNIIFTEYPDFIRIYYKFFENENMQEFAQRENILFLQEYAKIIDGKKLDDIGLIISYAPNFEYVFDRESNEIFYTFYVYTVDGNIIPLKDLDVKINSNDDFYQDKKINLWIDFLLKKDLDKTKKYEFLVEVSKKTDNKTMSRKFFLNFVDYKKSNFNKLSDLNKDSLFDWNIRYVDENTSLDKNANILIKFYGDKISYDVVDELGNRIPLVYSPNPRTMEFPTVEKSNLYTLLKHLKN